MLASGRPRPRPRRRRARASRVLGILGWRQARDRRAPRARRRGGGARSVRCGTREREGAERGTWRRGSRCPGPAALERPLPHRQRHQDIRGRARPPARRGGQVGARRSRRALASRARPKWAQDHRAAPALTQVGSLRLRRGTGVLEPERRLEADRARRARDRASARAASRRGVRLLQHELRRARAHRGEGGRRAAGSLLRSRLLRPLGLRRTSFEPGLVRGAHVHGHRPPSHQGVVTGAPADTSDEAAWWSWAAAGMVSTAEDLQRFFRALLGGRVVGPALLRDMKTLVPAGRQRYGPGLATFPTPCGRAWGHTGNAQGMIDGRLEHGRRVAPTRARGQHVSALRRARGSGACAPGRRLLLDGLKLSSCGCAR